MCASASEWTPTEITVNAKMDSGRVIEVENVPAKERNGEIRYNPDYVIKQYFYKQAEKIGLEKYRDFCTLTLLAAPAGQTGQFEATFSPYIYHMNKMLFYQWKKIEEDGLGNAIPRDEFKADRKGPVPENIYEDLERLEDGGLIEVDWPDEDEEGHRPVTIKLTEEGEEIAREAFESADTWFKAITQDVKTMILPLTPETLKNRVHTDFPEYRRTYVEVDNA